MEMKKRSEGWRLEVAQPSPAAAQEPSQEPPRVPGPWCVGAPHLLFLLSFFTCRCGLLIVISAVFRHWKVSERSSEAVSKRPVNLPVV